MTIRYRQIEGLEVIPIGERKALAYPQGGRVLVDDWMLELWRYAEGKTLAEVLAGYALRSRSMDDIRTGLVCLVNAGFLHREGVDETEIATAVETTTNGPLVSAIIIGYEGRQWLEECIPSLLNQTYQPVEIVVVDNASPQQEMAEWIGRTYPQVILKRLDTPLSFAAANNLGVTLAHGEFLLFVNQDVKLDSQAVGRLVEAAGRQDNCAAVGAKLRFWWAPAFLNGLGNYVPDHSWGSDLGIGQLDLGQLDRLSTLPSMCMACALIPRTAWLAVGPIDDGFPMYYEDSDWSYRARLLGFQILAAPDAVAYHAFGGRVPGGESGGLTPKKQSNASYGRMRFILKLSDHPHNRPYISNYTWEDFRQFLASVARLRLANAAAYPKAYLRLARDYRGIRSAYAALKPRVVRDPEDVFTLPPNLPSSLIYNGLPLLTETQVRQEYKPMILMGRTRKMPEFSTSERRANLLIISNDIVDHKMAGPGLRYVEMARALADNLEVTLAVPNETNLEVPGVRIVVYREDVPASLEVLVQNHEQCLVSGYMVLKFPFLSKLRTRIIVDWYDPFFLENFYYYQKDSLDSQSLHNQTAIEVVNQLARIGDFFICGNERQRDLWIGILSANGRVNPYTLQQDQSLRRLIDVVGVGIPTRPPNRRPFLKGVHPAFPPNSHIVLWGGGIWNWLDPLTLVKAWKSVVNESPLARLVYLGTRHPNPQVPQHEIVHELVRLAEASGEKDKTIFFFEWLSLEDREALLGESDLGVTLHPIHAETHYSIRTRVLDYIWTGLPVLITEGDVTSEWVKKFKIGAIVPPENVDAVAGALRDLLAREKSDWDPAFEHVQAEMRWEAVIQPLLDFCLRGESAPDRLGFDRTMRSDPTLPEKKRVQGAFKKAAYLWATEGVGAMLGQTLFHIRWLLGKKEPSKEEE